MQLFQAKQFLIKQYIKKYSYTQKLGYNYRMNLQDLSFHLLIFFKEARKKQILYYLNSFILLLKILMAYFSNLKEINLFYLHLIFFPFVFFFFFKYKNIYIFIVFFFHLRKKKNVLCKNLVHLKNIYTFFQFYLHIC